MCPSVWPREPPKLKPPSPQLSIRVATRAPSSRGRFAQFLALEDFEAAARTRLPGPIFGYYAGGAETGQSLQANRRAFGDYFLLPRTLVDVSARSMAVDLFGQHYAAPFGIAPMGLSALACFEGDLALAQAAKAEKIPSILSATSLMPLEELAARSGADWFQAYLPGEDDRILAMIDRVAAGGYRVLVLTVDVPVAANRENNERAGFSAPLRPSLGLALEGMRHPGWLVHTWAATWRRRGVPHFENMDAFRGPPILAKNVVRDIGRRDGLCWEHVALIRSRWRGPLLLKGVLNPEDARKAADHGVDGIIVSNHGGRQLDGAPPPILLLPEIVKAAPGLKILVDSGFRRGSDVLKALALGADFVFVGRPFLYAAAVGGSAAIGHAIRLLKAEIDRDLALVGIPDLAAWLSCGADRHLLVRPTQPGTTG